MIDDIAALQYLYGVNEQYNAEDNVYSIGSFDDGTLNAKWGDNNIYAAIWDSGGADTFSWAGLNSVASINLNDGEFSSFGNITGPDDADLDNQWLPDGDGILGIGYGVIIENAIGGSSGDTIVGNEYANYLYGGTGAGVKDTLTGNGGADIFISCIADATTDLSTADSITDFINGLDKIGLEDRSFSDLSFSNDSGGTKIVDTSSSKVLFWLDGIDYALIDSEDFISTDFV
jgi:serralysin